MGAGLLGRACDGRIHAALAYVKALSQRPNPTRPDVPRSWRRLDKVIQDACGLRCTSVRSVGRTTLDWNLAQPQSSATEELVVVDVDCCYYRLQTLADLEGGRLIPEPMRAFSRSMVLDSCRLCPVARRTVGRVAMREWSPHTRTKAIDDEAPCCHIDQLAPAKTCRGSGAVAIAACSATLAAHNPPSKAEGRSDIGLADALESFFGRLLMAREA